MPAPVQKQAKLDQDNLSGLNVSDTQSALEEIDTCQDEIDSLNEKASEEILSIEQKYNNLRRPHYQKRSEIIQKIPNFWYTAFINHPQISSILNEKEENCLQSLTNVDVEEFDDIKSGYRITFTFKPNDFFNNEKLVKEFNLVSPDVSQSTSIEWKQGRNLVNKPEKSANGAKRLLPDYDGFFSWFTSNSDPDSDEMAEVIKDDMWPNPLQYYLASEIEVDAENGFSDDDDDDDEEAVVQLPEDYSSPEEEDLRDDEEDVDEEEEEEDQQKEDDGA